MISRALRSAMSDAEPSAGGISIGFRRLCVVTGPRLGAVADNDERCPSRPVASASHAAAAHRGTIMRRAPGTASTVLEAPAGRVMLGILALGFIRARDAFDGECALGAPAQARLAQGATETASDAGLIPPS